MFKIFATFQMDGRIIVEINPRPGCMIFAPAPFEILNYTDAKQKAWIEIVTLHYYYYYYLDCLVGTLSLGHLVFKFESCYMQV